jgi:peptide/nickel transport system permease protein
MLKFLLSRFLATIPVMLVVAVFVFLLLRLTPGDPAAIIAGDVATSDQIEKIRETLGLTRPIYEQFFIWIGKLLTFDFGESFFYKKQVSALIADRIEPTLSLSFVTLVIAVSVAVPMGILAAYKQNTWIDRVVMAFSVMGFSVPVFVIGYLLIYVFAIANPWFPTQGYNRIANGFFPWLENLILPSLALSVVFIALIARMTRASMLDVLSEDFVKTARAKGQTETRVLVSHALKVAAVPIITVIGIGLASLIGGVVVTETVFSIPGLGRLTVDAVLARDFPVIQIVILLFSFVYIFINLLIDIIYVLVDPRINY